MEIIPCHEPPTTAHVPFRVKGAVKDSVPFKGFHSQKRY